MRLDADARAKAFPLPADVSVEPVIANGVQAEWTSTPDADPSSAILYLHGGGYVICSLDSHRHLVAEVGRAAGTRTLAIDYRLAPEHPFPAPVEDTVAAYRYLLDSGLKPNRIALAGDSAGGGLVVGALLAIREAGLPLPGCGWCISPWVDMEALGESFTDRAAADPTVQKATIQMMAQWYLGGADPRHPHAAPIYGDLRGLAAVADPGRCGRNVAGRFRCAGTQSRRGRCARRSADLARNDPHLAHLFPDAVGRTARHRLGRNFRAECTQIRPGENDLDGCSF